MIFNINKSIIWLTRGKKWGFRFLSTGPLSNDEAMVVYDQIFADNDAVPYAVHGKIYKGSCAKYYYVALRFYDDISKRCDESGRRIIHEIVVVTPFANGIIQIDADVHSFCSGVKEYYDSVFYNEYDEVGMVWPELNVDFNIVNVDDGKMRNVVIQWNFRKDGCCGKRNEAQFSYVRIGIFLLALSLVIFFRKEIIEMADLAMGVVVSRFANYSVEERVDDIASRKPELQKLAEEAYGKLEIYVFKKERIVELVATRWKKPRKYSMTGFSGKLGPKLVEGDRQIPEGVYGIEYLNPNSKFYLSVKVGYPNEDDLRWARQDGRKNLGGDIMIHGKNATVGCVPIGDDSIEDVFYLVNAVGCKNVKVIIAPYDMRNGRRKEWENNPLPWYSELCKKIEKELTISGPSSK